jgi:hypothetical protein
MTNSLRGLRPQPSDGAPLRVCDEERFRRASTAWAERGRGGGLERWLADALDPDGVPRRWAVADWTFVLTTLAEMRRRRGESWPVALDARIEGLCRAALRFTRPDGTPVFEPPGSPEDPAQDLAQTFRTWAVWLSDPGIARVVHWWFPNRGRSGEHAPPPLPADARPDRPLAVLRENWSRQGDLLAIDHRIPGALSAIELYAMERPWLGPSWSLDLGAAPASRARPTCWTSTPSADLAEWSFRLGRSRVIRSALLLRGRRLALLADQVERPVSMPAPTLQIGLAEGVEPRPIPDSRGFFLAGGRGRSTLRVFPIGLPFRSTPTDLGAFTAGQGGLGLTQRIEGKRGWLPILLSWEPGRNRLPTRWRLLTVSEKSRVCPPDVAFAARITWGRHETLVVYRSLARPALRTFLGHQTRARFLVGLFAHDTGNVEPLLKVEE